MTYLTNIPREELASMAPLSPEEAVPDDLLRLLAYGDAEAMAEVTGSMQVAEMAGELLAYRLQARTEKQNHKQYCTRFAAHKRSAGVV